ncbi:ABC transporter substrate-binding protein [Gordonia sp. PP30]|uniref:ABC transporter substrate-binding protein n=1 Tax=Gordonia sp. PP30 TaxID=2935861 RepID=UPI001FFFFBC5|nr:ABC transporter substrate-binding protein [Gordonia sp. PP30]UQE77077.1 ABC transporter substrate-binding protein [Gordonia sp. PP30]
MAAALILTGCAGDTESRNDQLTLADAYDLGRYNPMLGYGSLGVSPIYESLLAPSASDDERIPDLVPVLAAQKPIKTAPRTWRVRLRDKIRFSDGTAFDSADVVATYAAMTDPAVAADISTQAGPVSEVTADGPDAVIVRMDTEADPSPYLLVGIVPSERVEKRPAAQWALNTSPVGTGPYRLDSLRPDQAVLVARDDYWRGKPTLRRVVYTAAPDDNSRAQRVAAGEIDGAGLPPRLAQSLRGRSGIDVVSVNSADWRGVSLPRGNAFAADPAARRAMNLGVDRAALVDGVLAGAGAPASTPISPAYGPAYEPRAQFGFESGAAARLLDESGWRAGRDGIRAKDGTAARFTLLYNADDTLRRDLAVAFAAAMKPIGIRVEPKGVSWDAIDTRLNDDAVMLGGGETPYSIDSQIYDALHTQVPGGSRYSNPGDFTAPGLDELLEQARRSAAGPANDTRYRRIQTLYAEQPSSVFLVFLRHTYAARSAGWTHAAPILEPHAHGVVWGPWWNLPSWHPSGS